MTTIGIYGKLPSKGDFVTRNLPDSFVQPWDQWLQQSLAGTQQQLGEAWASAYIAAPVWCFVIPPGLLDEQGWTGIVASSVDSVGRYFPLTFAMPLATAVDPLRLYRANLAWYQALIALMYRALEAGCDVMRLEHHLLRLVPLDDSALSLANQAGLDQEALDATSCFWACQDGESEQHYGCVSRGLPTVNQYRALLDLELAQAGWQSVLQPF